VRLASVLALGVLKPWKQESIAPDILQHLKHADSGVRYSALECLAELRAAALEEHTAALAAMLDDYDGDNRLLAMQLLCKLKPASIEPHASKVVERLEDADSDVRLTAMRVLSRLEPSALVQHAADVVQKLVVQTLNHEHELELVDQSHPTGTWVAPGGHSGALQHQQAWATNRPPPPRSE